METDDNFEMTPEEMSRIKEAMKDKKFVDLLMDYSREISDPENKKKYEEEIIAMEKQQGQNVRLLQPTSGFVVKTLRQSDGMKVFLNICTSPEIEDCTLTPDTVGGKVGTRCHLPHSLSPIREDVDKVGKPCIVYDVCFNPSTYDKSLNDINFRNMLVDAAFDTLEKQATDKFNRKNKRFPKMKYKGTPHTNILRTFNTAESSSSNPNTTATAMSNGDSNLKGSVNLLSDIITGVKKCNISNNNIPLIGDSQTLADEKSNLTATTPEYKIVHRGYFDMQNFTLSREGCSTIPKELIVNINLPLAKSAAGLDLDIFKKELILDSKEPLYHLEVPLPYEVNESEGNAQFDTAEKVLSVTLPVIKPQLKDIVSDIAPPSFVEDVTDTINCDKMDEQNSSDICTSNLQNELANEKQENGPLEDTVSSMVCDNFPTNTGTTVDVDMLLIREHLEKAYNLNALSNDIGIEFDTSNLESFPTSSKIPSYSYIQTTERINLSINIPQVKIIHLSLGFNSQQVYMSYPLNPEDINSACWEMVIRLDNNCYLDQDNCGVDIKDDTVELILRKREDSVRLWDKFFVGVSEASLKVEFFTTHNIAEDMSKNALGLETKDDGILLDNNFTNLESRLSQLLQEQENTGGVSICDDDDVFSEEPIMNGEITSQDNLLKLQKSHENAVECKVIENKLNHNEDRNFSPKHDVIDTQDSVAAENKTCANKNIKNENITKDEVNSSNNCTTQETHIKKNGSHVCSTGSMSPEKCGIKTRRGYGRSLSSGHYEEDTNLHSILKASKSEEDFDTEDELTSSSCSSFADPELIFGSSPLVFECGRRRYKSVTFNDEPTVFEFTKLTKKEIKKQMKEERLRSASLPRNMLFEIGDEKEENEKVSKKKGKADKTLNRSHSDSILQIPNSIVNYNKNQKKKKKDKKRHNQGIEGQPSNVDSETNDKETTTINNSLQFELE